MLLAHNTETRGGGIPIITDSDYPFSPGDRKNWHDATPEEIAAHDAYLAALDARRERRHAPRRAQAIEDIIAANYGDDEGFDSAFADRDLDQDAIRALMAEAYNAGAGIR